MQNNPMPENIVPWLQTLQNQVNALKTRETGTIYVNEQIVSVDPATGVKTIFGDLGGRTGLQEWVGDTEPPAVPTMPYVVYSLGGYTITWDGAFELGAEKTPDFSHCKIYGTNGTIVAYVGTLINTNDTAPYTDITTGDSWSFWLTSADENGNESGPGEMSPSIIATSLVEVPDLKDVLSDIDQSVQAAQDAAAQATAAANLASNALQAAKEAALVAIGAEAGKGGVILSDTAPTDSAYLDGNWLWIRETDGVPFVYDGTNWIQSADPAVIDAANDVIDASSLAQQAFDKATDAAKAAGDAQTAANSKNTIWYDTPPIDGTHKIGDTWFDSTDDNKIKVWDGTNWVLKRDQLLVRVEEDIVGVKQTVGSKNASYFDLTEPLGTTEIPLVKGDLWFDIDDDYKLYTYDGANWQVTQDSAGALESANSNTTTEVNQALVTAAQTAQQKADAAAELIEDRAISRGTDLVTNGTGLLGNNYNFPSATFDPTNAPTGASGSFVSGTGLSGRIETAEIMPVDSARVYLYRLQVKQLNPAVTDSRFYAALVPYDGADLVIQPQHYYYDPNTMTTLAAQLSPGDTQVQVTSTAGWVNSSPYNYYVGIWNWTDSLGKVWEPGTYTRNNPEWVSISGNTITLEAPYAGPIVPAGNPVSMNKPGGNFMYLAASSAVAPPTWETFAGTTKPGIHDGTTGSAVDQFPQGTAGAKILFLTNYHTGVYPVGEESRQAFAAISLSDATAAYEEASAALIEAQEAHKAAGEAETLADAALNAATHTGQNLFDDDPPSGTAPKGTMWFQNNLKGTVPTSPPQAIIGMWQQIDGVAPVVNADGTITEGVGGANWQKREVSKEIMGNLDAGMITSGFISADRIQAGSLVIGGTTLGAKVTTYDDTTNTVSGITDANGNVVSTAITGTLATSNIPELPQTKVTGLPTIADNATSAKTKTDAWVDSITGGIKATVVEGTLEATNIPTLSQDKVTGLTTIASNADNANTLTQLWKTAGTTTINGGQIETNTVEADKLGATVIVGNYIKADLLDAEVVRSKLILAELIDAKDILVSGSITAESAIIASLDGGVITANSILGTSIAAKTITADKVIIGAGNVLPDPNFDDPEGWTNGATWIQPTGGRNGGKSLLMPQSTTQLVTHYGANSEVRRPRVTQGTSYYVSAWFSSTVEIPIYSAYMYLHAYDKLGNLVLCPPTSKANSEVVPANTWSELSAIFEVPEGYTQIVLVLSKSDLLTTGELRWSDPAIREAASGVVISNGAITAPKIATDAVTADKILANSVTTEALDAGAITAKHTITGALIQTDSALNRGIKLNAQGLFVYDDLGETTLFANAFTGDLTVVGQFQTGFDGARVVIYDDGTAAYSAFFADESEQHGSIFTQRHGAIAENYYRTVIEHHVNLDYANTLSSAVLQLNNDGAFQIGRYVPGGGFQGLWAYPDGFLSLGNNGGAVGIAGDLTVNLEMDLYGGRIQFMSPLAGYNKVFFQSDYWFRFSNLLSSTGGTVESGWFMADTAISTPELQTPTDILKVYSATNTQFYVGGSRILDIGPGSLQSITTYNRTASGSANMLIGSSGAFNRTTSLAKHKVAIDRRWIEKDSWKGIKDLRPVTYYDRANAERYAAYLDGDADMEDDSEYPMQLLGFLAEDVSEVMPLLNTYADKGELNGVAYDRIPAAQQMWLLEHEQEIKALKKEIAKLKASRS